MTTLAIPLPEDRLRELREAAERLKVSPEELARAGVEDFLTRRDERFLRAAEFVLEKNAELYRRLS